MAIVSLLYTNKSNQSSNQSSNQPNMFHLASTRFNTATLSQNMSYREKNNKAAIYGTIIKIHRKITIGSFLFIIEMNNEENKIEGISLIKNSLVLEKKHKIYENEDYNHYIYGGDYWISRQQILQHNSSIAEIFDKILFKGKTHLKRACGITVLNESLFINWKQNIAFWKEEIRQLFIKIFEIEMMETIRERGEEILEEEQKEQAML